jgi:transposase
MDGIVLSWWQRRGLERQLHETIDARVFRRTLAILEVSRGVPMAEVARTLAISRQSIYNWIDAYCQSYDPHALIDAPHVGRPRVWTEFSETLLDSLMQTSPEQFGYYALNWTVPLLQDYLEECTGKSLSEDTIRRELSRLDYVWKRTRYVLKPDPDMGKKNAKFGGE